MSAENFSVESTRSYATSNSYGQTNNNPSGGDWLQERLKKEPSIFNIPQNAQGFGAYMS